MKSVFWPDCIFILFTTHALLPIKVAQYTYIQYSSVRKETTIYQLLSVGNRRAKQTAASASVNL